LVFNPGFVRREKEPQEKEFSYGTPVGGVEEEEKEAGW
jgi:hypothetical protein